MNPLDNTTLVSKWMQYFLKAIKIAPYFYVRDCNSHQKLLPMHHKIKQIAIILLTTMKPTARKQPQPSKKYKVIPNSLDFETVQWSLWRDGEGRDWCYEAEYKSQAKQGRINCWTCTWSFWVRNKIRHDMTRQASVCAGWGRIKYISSKRWNVGGEKRLSATGQRPQILLKATKDSNFTVLGFTAANGMPLKCTIIFDAKEMKESWVLGFNPTVDLIGDKNDVTGNIGRGRRHPMGPTCNFNGHHMPTFF